jgi:hypothetical protein
VAVFCCCQEGIGDLWSKRVGVDIDGEPMADADIDGVPLGTDLDGVPSECSVGLMNP